MSTQAAVTEVALLSYNPIVGWRVACVSKSRFPVIAVVRIGSLKLLRIPKLTEVVPGRFCNPRKLLGV